jgi:hypothetical protein
VIICKICGGRISNEVACCARCFTPHHFDCWGFFGQCSIFACGCKDHKYFDFREKSEAEVLAAIGQSLAVALREEPARPAESAATENKKSADDLLTYKRGLFRSLHAVLQKVAPGSVQDSSELIDSFEAEVDGKDVPRLFLADDLEIDADRPSHKPDLNEKKRLLHALAQSNLPEVQKPWLERFKEWLKELLGG